MSDSSGLTGKQRQYLKAMATGMDAILQVGKGGISENLIKQVDSALESRELIKLRALPASGIDVGDIAKEIAEHVGAEIVQIIGHIFILYRQSEKKPKLRLPQRGGM